MSDLRADGGLPGDLEQRIRFELASLRVHVAELERLSPGVKDLRPETSWATAKWDDQYRLWLFNMGERLDCMWAGKCFTRDDGAWLWPVTNFALLSDMSVVARAATSCVERLLSLTAATEEPHGCVEFEHLIGRLHDLHDDDEPEPVEVAEVALTEARAEDPLAREWRKNHGPLWGAEDDLAIAPVVLN